MNSCRLYVMIALTGMLFGAEIIASQITQSLVLLTDSYHMLYNIMNLFLLCISYRIGKMTKEKSLKNTFGWARVEVLGVLITILFLTALCFAVTVEGIQTIVHASHEKAEPRYPLLVLLLGVMSLNLNILCFILIGGYTHHQSCYLSIQGNEVQVNFVLSNKKNSDLCPGPSPAETVEDSDNLYNHNLQRSTTPRDPVDRLVDIVRDISTCFLVIAVALVVYFMEGPVAEYVDPLLSFLCVFVLMATTYPFMKESGLILLQTVPGNMDVEDLKKRLTKEFPAVLNVHDLHVWRLANTEIIATAHIILSSPAVYSAIADHITDFFLKEGITLATVQPEFCESAEVMKEHECILNCSLNNNCGNRTCCGHLHHHEKQKNGIKLRHHHCGSDDTKALDVVRSGEVSKLQSSIDMSPATDLRDFDDIHSPQYEFHRIYSCGETKL